MPAIIKEFFEGHGTAAARTIHRAMTIHMNLLNQLIILIQTDRCHDLMTGTLNFYLGRVNDLSKILLRVLNIHYFKHFTFDSTGNRMEKILPFWGSL